MRYTYIVLPGELVKQYPVLTMYNKIMERFCWYYIVRKKNNILTDVDISINGALCV